MSEILNGMTREQALRCLLDVTGKGISHTRFFTKSPTTGEVSSYGCPSAIGLSEKCGTHDHRKCWETALNAHYDDLEKPKWVEPKFEHKTLDGLITGDEIFHVGFIGCLSQEVARTNARRKIEAFIKANGGRGKWEIRWLDEVAFCSDEMIPAYYCVGGLYCATRKLAEAVIERFPAELRLLAGLEEKK